MQDLNKNSLLSLIYKDEKNRQPGENEYIAEDGYIYCSICKMPKQSEVGGFLHPEMCECQRKEKERVEAEEEAERHRKVVESRRNDCFESVCKYADCTFDSCDTDINGRIKDFCFNYCLNWEDMQNESVGLIFCGNVGRGKTHFAACICNKLIEDFEVRAKIVTENEFIEKYSIIADRSEYLSELLRYQLLVFDELGVQTLKGNNYPTGYLQFLEDLINRWYNARKPIIVTSNLPKSFFTNPSNDIITNRVTSRLKEMAAEPIVFNGEDIRARKQKEKVQRLKQSTADSPM